MELSMQEFVLAYRNFSEYWAKHYINQKWVKDSGLEYEDLYQHGLFLLCTEYYKYDKEKGAPSTYASFIIKYGLLKYINENNHLTKSPHQIKASALKLYNEMTKFYQRNGKKMTKLEMLEYVKNECNSGHYVVNMQYIDTLLNIRNFHIQCQRLPLEERALAASDIGFVENEIYTFDALSDCIASEYNLEEEIIDKVYIEEIIKYIKMNFSEIDYDIILETFGFGGNIKKPQREIAEKYGITRQSINLRYHKVITKVRKKFSN